MCVAGGGVFMRAMLMDARGGHLVGRVIGSCKLPSMVAGPLQEQQVPLALASSPQAQKCLFVCFKDLKHPFGGKGGGMIKMSRPGAMISFYNSLPCFTGEVPKPERLDKPWWKSFCTSCSQS